MCHMPRSPFRSHPFMSPAQSSRRRHRSRTAVPGDRACRFREYPDLPRGHPLSDATVPETCFCDSGRMLEYHHEQSGFDGLAVPQHASSISCSPFTRVFRLLDPVYLLVISSFLALTLRLFWQYLTPASTHSIINRESRRQRGDPGEGL